MAKKAYILSSSFIKTLAPSADGALEGVGTGAFKSSFDIKALVASQCFSRIWGGIVFSIGSGENVGKIYVYTDEAGETSFDFEFAIGTQYSVVVERDGSGNTSLTVDGDLKQTLSGTAYDWSVEDANVAGRGSWRIGWGQSYTWFFEITNFKFWKGASLVVDLPLSGDFTENVSGRTFEFDNASSGYSTFADLVALPDPLTGSFLVGKDGSDNWNWNFGGAFSSIIAGDVVSLNATKNGGGLHFPVEILASESFDTVKIVFTGLDLFNLAPVVHSGLGGATTTAKFCAHKNNVSPLLTSLVDYQAVMGAIAGGVGDGSLTSTITYADAVLSETLYGNESPDLKSIVNEVKALGDIDGLTIFLQDHEGNSPSDMSYCINALTTTPVLVVNYGGAPSTYTVTYDANGGTGTVTDENSPYEESEEVTVLASTGISREGHLFAGWNTAADGSGTDYAPAATFEMPAENVTLYAQWDLIPEYSVTYDGNENTGGSVPTDENTYEEDEEVTVLGNTGSLVKTGYTFAGWNTAADGSGTDYAPAATFAMPAENVTLYAQWAEIPEYSVTYDGNENTGGSVPTDENTYEEDEEVTVLGNTGSLVNTGYTFAGWNTAADGSGTDYAPAATFAMPAGNVTLFAQWDEIPGYKIQLKKPCLIKPVLEKIGLVRPRLIKSK